MKILDSTSDENKIEYPTQHSEFEVHAELYGRLKEMDWFDVRAEVKARGTHGLRKSKTSCRFDIVLFIDKVAVCIIEVKDGKTKHKTTVEDTRQGQRYPSFGIPVVFCYGFDDIQNVINYSAELSTNSLGKHSDENNSRENDRGIRCKV